MSQEVHIIILVAIMIGCGLLGGLINFWSENIGEHERHPLLRRLSLGVVAALIVPLFLNMIASSLLSESRTNILILLVFAGFCLIAAVSSRTFIDSISKKIISKIDALDAQQTKLETHVAPLVAKETEPRNVATDGLKGREYRNLDDDTKKVLRALGSSRYSWRYVNGIVNDTSIDKSKVESTLLSLLHTGLATRNEQQERDELWGLTNRGHDALAAIGPESDGA